MARKDFPSNSVVYYFSDHLKTASVITNAAGVITAESDYYPWGGELQFVNNDSNHYKFTSKEQDSETGLDYFGARYYSNGLGRFMSSDWSATPVPVPYADLTDPHSLNQYSYVRNVPTTRIDDDGHDDGGTALLESVERTVVAVKEFVATEAPGPVASGAARLGFIAIVGVALGLEAKSFIDAKANYTKAEADMEMVRALAPQDQAAAKAAYEHMQEIVREEARKRNHKGSKGGRTAGKRFKPSDRKKDAGKNCIYCGVETTEEPGFPNSRETDHIYPRSRGGNTNDTNRGPACRTCNRSKRNLTPSEWRRELKKRNDIK